MTTLTIWGSSFAIKGNREMGWRMVWVRGRPLLCVCFLQGKIVCAGENNLGDTRGKSVMQGWDHRCSSGVPAWMGRMSECLKHWW